jgi:hypothetical protein
MYKYYTLMITTLDDLLARIANMENKANTYSKERNNTIKIQSCWRGYFSRKELKRPVIIECLDHYIYGLKFTENIAKFVIARKYGIMPSWNNKKGDIVIDKPVIFKQIEVKGFTSYGAIVHLDQPVFGIYYQQFYLVD